jgi:protoporphyrinogen oxidase
MNQRLEEHPSPRLHMRDQQGVVVLGGGLAGIAASYYSGAPVYEAESRVGGVAASDKADGFTFDRGIHVLQTQNQKVLSLFDDIGVEMKTHTRRASIYYRGRYTEYPFQVNTAALPIGLRIRCVWGFLQRGKEPEPANYEEWIVRSVGKAFAETFLIPYSEKFWTVHPREMTFEWTGNRVPQPTTWQVLRGAIWEKHTKIGTNSVFRYPAEDGGYGTIAETLAARVSKVHLSHRATRIDTRERCIRFENGISVDYEVLVSSIPLPDLVALCADAPDQVRQAARQLRTNSIMVVNLGVDRDHVSDRHWVHFPERDISFFRISFPHNFSADVAPRGTSSISAEVAYSNDKPIDRNTIVPRVVDDLGRVGILRKSDIILTTATRNIKYAYCIYDRQRKSALRVIHDWLGTRGIVPCGRYGLWTYFWSDEAILSGRKAAESIQSRRERAAVGAASVRAASR